MDWASSSLRWRRSGLDMIERDHRTARRLGQTPAVSTMRAVVHLA